MDAAQAAGKAAKTGQGNPTGKTTILSFAEAAWKAGQKIKNEGFGDRSKNGTSVEMTGKSGYTHKMRR